jgi:hypothetical protein
MSKKGSASVDFKADCSVEDEYEYTDEEPAPLSGNESNLEAHNTVKDTSVARVPNPELENTNLLTTINQVEVNTDKQASTDQKTNPD